MMRWMAALPLLFAAVGATAQDDPEYRMEIGVGAGLGGYLGDFNGSLAKNMQPMASAVARYVLSPYMAVKMNVGYLKMKGKSTGSTSYYPDYAAAPYSFSNTLVDVGLMYEYNFWPYGTGRDYRGAKRLTPFVAGGLGLTFVGSKPSSTFTANLPIGVGVKYKVGARINVGVEWIMHFAMSDKLDGVKDPYTIPSSGAFKNTDCYQALQVTLTYSFLAKCRTCHNADE